jgi:O-antigen/teichoic acid export membrane protein
MWRDKWPVFSRELRVFAVLIRYDTNRNETYKENTMILFVFALIVTVFLATSVGWAIFTWSYTKDLRDEIERLQWELGAGVPKGR